MITKSDRLFNSLCVSFGISACVAAIFFYIFASANLLGLDIFLICLISILAAISVILGLMQILRNSHIVAVLGILLSLTAVIAMILKELMIGLLA